MSSRFRSCAARVVLVASDNAAALRGSGCAGSRPRPDGRGCFASVASSNIVDAVSRLSSRPSVGGPGRGRKFRRNPQHMAS